jgi:two-component system LytT family response regulator
MIRAIALDDEEPALRVIDALCQKTEGQIRLEKTFTQPVEAIKYLKKFPVDLIFLDINMPGISGVEFAKQLDPGIMIVFSTAYSEYAVEGFNLQAIDYLMKPIAYDRFLQAVNKAKQQMENQLVSNEKPYLSVRANYSLLRIYTENILYIEGMDDYLKIHVKDQRPIVVRMTMKSVEEKLPSKEFVRVHRSFIVPLSRIDKIRNKIIHLQDVEIPIGNKYEEIIGKKYEG